MLKFARATAENKSKLWRSRPSLKSNNVVLRVWSEDGEFLARDDARLPPLLLMQLPLPAATVTLTRCCESRVLQRRSKGCETRVYQSLHGQRRRAVAVDRCCRCSLSRSRGSGSVAAAVAATGQVWHVVNLIPYCTCLASRQRRRLQWSVDGLRTVESLEGARTDGRTFIFYMSLPIIPSGVRRPLCERICCFAVWRPTCRMRTRPERVICRRRWP
jgi:hypothetical protein